MARTPAGTPWPSAAGGRDRAHGETSAKRWGRPVGGTPNRHALCPEPPLDNNDSRDRVGVVNDHGIRQCRAGDATLSLTTALPPTSSWLRRRPGAMSRPRRQVEISRRCRNQSAPHHFSIRFGRAAGKHPAMLIERETELSVLHGMLAESRRGRGQVIRVSGATGMGRSELPHVLGEDACATGAVFLGAVGRRKRSQRGRAVPSRARRGPPHSAKPPARGRRS